MATKSLIQKMTFLFLIIGTIFSQESTVGLVFSDTTQVCEGYTLFTPKDGTSTYLIDNKGKLVHEWQSEYLPTMTVYLLEDGNLLRATGLSDGGGLAGGFQVLDWDGNVVWQYTQPTQHHDIEPLPNGNVLMIVNDAKSKAEVKEFGGDPANLSAKIRGLGILEIAPDGSGGGDVVWQWSIWDHIIQDFDSTKSFFGNITEHPELLNVNFHQVSDPDWLHTNGMDYNPNLDQIMVSNRNVNEIWIIDHSTTTEEAASHEGGNCGNGGDFLYRWGNAASYGANSEQTLFGLHDAHWIPEGLEGAGHIMLFNNGIGRGDNAFSSADELVLPLNAENLYDFDNVYGPEELFWTYELSVGYYSSKYSSTQRLPNGNTMICSGDNGLIFEINTANEIVWQYNNPVADTGIVYQGEVPFNSSVGRAHKYSKDYAGLIGKDLAPIGTIEKYYDTGIDDFKQLNEYKLNNNYPNPFNPSTTISYEINRGMNVKLEIYDISGKRIRTIVNGYKTSGKYSVLWNGMDESGKPVASGIYLYQLTGETGVIAKKMLLTK